MSKFKVRDRVSIREEYAHKYTIGDGEIVRVETYCDPTSDTTDYEVLMDDLNMVNCFPDYEITFPREYLDFLEKIKDRML